jgi:anti-anti-sigma factor
MPVSRQHHDSLPDWFDFFETCPLSVQMYTLDGDMIAFNQAASIMWNMPLSSAEEVSVDFNILTDPQLAAAGIPALFRRVVQGETLSSPPHLFDTKKLGMPDEESGRRWVETTYFPIKDSAQTITHIGLLHRDVTESIEQTHANETTKQQLEEQHSMIMELSSPVVKVWEEIIALPLIGTIDTHRATTITENLLEAIVQHQAACVIIDITGVAVIDTQVANYLLSAARACRLLGSQVALVGISSEIAQTIVHLGVNIESLVTRADLQAGIAWAFKQQGLSIDTADK